MYVAYIQYAMRKIQYAMHGVVHARERRDTSIAGCGNLAAWGALPSLLGSGRLASGPPNQSSMAMVRSPALRVEVVHRFMIICRSFSSTYGISKKVEYDTFTRLNLTSNIFM